MTDFFTRCWRSARAEWLVVVFWFCGCGLLPAAAQTPPTAAEILQLRVDREADGLYLHATLRIALPPAVEDALLKGVPMFFLAEADIVRHRWYWSDKSVVRAQRHMRLAYHPLTRRWRLNVASGVITSSSLGLALNLSFDSLEDALASLQRFSGWKIAEAGVLEPDATHRLDFRFSLDLAQLPRPFQIGALGHADWNIAASATQILAPGAKPGE